jgi:hypothetical protein
VATPAPAVTAPAVPPPKWLTAAAPPPALPATHGTRAATEELGP